MIETVHNYLLFHDFDVSASVFFSTLRSDVTTPSSLLSLRD